MVRRKEAQVSTLVYVAVILGLCFIHIPESTTGIYEDCHFYGRLLYPFFHASFLHALLNAWCLLSIIFIYPVSSWMLLGAYIISASFPVGLFASLYDASLPTIGASGICYALIGRLSFVVRRKLLYQSWALFFLCIGFFLPYANAWLHLYCYLCGLILGLLNKPIRIR